MATLKEFEDALRSHGMVNALAILEQLKKRDREKRSIAPARRVVGRKMTAELARSILEMHGATTMTQQEIAFKLGVNQGRVNEVIKRGKWLNGETPGAAVASRNKAIKRLSEGTKARAVSSPVREAPIAAPAPVRLQRAAPSVSRDRPLSVAEPKVAGELPFAKPENVAPQGRVAPAGKPQLHRGENASATPIVSAQLAFLDL